MNNRIL